MAMGYGGVAGQGTVTGKSGDGGIDGVIKQDKLGLDVVCIQAKRWDGAVGRPIIQGFVGSMDYVRARKGVILTTSTFTKDAVDYVETDRGQEGRPHQWRPGCGPDDRPRARCDDDQDLRDQRGVERLLR